MKRNIVYAIVTVLLLGAFSGCGKTTDVTPTPTPINKEVATIPVLDDYALLSGHILYQDTANNSYSIQLPEGCQINDADPNNVIISIENEFGQTDTINIKYDADAEVIDTEAQLMESLKNDDSIDITGFFLLTNNGVYKGYKYTYTAVSDPNFKSIKSVYFAGDRSAYIITAASPNGNDDVNMNTLNTVVETFINYK